jgi:hypothetical protein
MIPRTYEGSLNDAVTLFVTLTTNTLLHEFET